MEEPCKMKLISALQKPELFPHPIEKFELIETHLSWVLLTGSFAYKIKKAVNLGVVDFTTLAKRKHYCQLEVMLNQRLASLIYVDVIAISGTPEQPQLNDSSPIEYAVKMKQFPQQDLFTVLAYEDKLTVPIIKAVAQQVAFFHLQAQPCEPNQPFGEPDNIFTYVEENFSTLKKLLENPIQVRQLMSIATWAHHQFAKIKHFLVQRKKDSFVRACHGDLHLGNIVMYQGKPLIFDCIEFNENFRWTDVMNDVSFLAMDLAHHHLPGLKNIFLNQYFDLTADYMGAPLIPFYQSYRAMVRAKVTAFQLKQLSPHDPLFDLLQNDLSQLLTLAQSYTFPAAPKLIFTVGPSGSGKTLFTEHLLLWEPNAIRLRSDILRKRNHQMDPYQPTPADQISTVYSEQSTQTLYQQLHDLAQHLLSAGFCVIIDATCLYSWQRQLFMTLASRLNVPCQILVFSGQAQALQERIQHRLIHHPDPSDADEKVLQWQLANFENLTPEEQKIAKEISSAEISQLIAQKEV